MFWSEKSTEFFYKPIKTKRYSSKYILIRNKDERGNYDGSCLSYIGFVDPIEYQTINMGNENCGISNWAINTNPREGMSIMQHEMIHALGLDLKFSS